MTALRFLYGVTVQRERFIEMLPMPRKQHYLPVILSPAQVLRFLEAAPSFVHRVIFSTMYGTGMRVSQAVHLRMRHMDSQRMMIRMEQSQGNRDRDVPLSPKLLELLRAYWRKVRPREWLFPGQNPGQPLGPEAVGPAVTLAARRAGLTNKPSPHCLTHSFAVHLLETGTDLRKMQLLGGHRSLATTARYLYLTTATLCAVTSPLDLLPYPIQDPQQ